MSMKEDLFSTLEKESNECSEENMNDEGSINLRECTNKGVGYTTIIPDEVYDKVTALFKAHDDLREAMRNSSSETIKLVRSIPQEEAEYAMIEFMFFNDMMREAWDSITDLVAIHEILSKESIDRQVNETGTTLKDVIRMKMFNEMMDMLHK